MGAQGAGGANALETEVVKLAVAAAAGGVNVTDNSALLIDTVGAVAVNRVTTTGTAGSGDITDSVATLSGLITAASSNGGVMGTATELTTAQVVDADGTGVVRLESTVGAITLNNAVSSDTGHITVIAKTSLTQAASGDITTSGAGTVDVEAGTSITMVGGATASSTVVTAGKDIRYEAKGGNLQLGSFLTDNNATTGGAVSLIASGSLIDGDTDLDITGARAYLQSGASGAVGGSSDRIEISVHTLALSAGSGGAFVEETDTLAVNAFDRATLQRVSNAGVAQAQAGSVEDLTVAGGGSLVVLVNAGTLTVEGGAASATSAVSVAGAGKVLLRTVAGAMTVNAGIASSGNGNISLRSAGSQTFGADGDISTGVTSGVAGSIDVSADAAAAQVTMNAGTTFRTDGGAIRVVTGESGTAGGNITLGILDTRLSADRSATPATLTGQANWGPAAVVSTGGSIVDTVADTAINVFAKTLRLSAGAAATSTIGISLEAIETEVLTLSALAGGAIHLRESTSMTVGQTPSFSVNRVQNDASIVAETQATTTNLNAGAALVVELDAGTLTIDAPVSAAGNALIRTAAADGDIDLNAALAVTGGGASSLAGHLSISAGRDLLIDANVSTAAASATIDIQAGRHVQQGGTTQSVTLTSANGDIALRAAGNIVLETVNAGTADVLLEAGGSIMDGDAADRTSSEVDGVAAGEQLQPRVQPRCHPVRAPREARGSQHVRGLPLQPHHPTPSSCREHGSSDAAASPAPLPPRPPPRHKSYRLPQPRQHPCSCPSPPPQPVRARPQTQGRRHAASDSRQGPCQTDPPPPP